MSARVGAMLDEKDRMLGAIGHDCAPRWPRSGSAPNRWSPRPSAQKVIATIEEMTAMLDDTLALARSGRAAEPARRVDLDALADAVVEEFRTLGQDVEMEAGERHVAAVQPNLLRRALRNLIENGVKYGGGARVAVREAGGSVAIEVADRGPGIPGGELGNVQEAFVRLEGSRNRETGGSGLGLTLARSAAQAHGGRLELENRPEGGLVARICSCRARARSSLLGRGKLFTLRLPHQSSSACAPTWASALAHRFDVVGRLDLLEADELAARLGQQIEPVIGQFPPPSRHLVHPRRRFLSHETRPETT